MLFLMSVVSLTVSGKLPFVVFISFNFYSSTQLAVNVVVYLPCSTSRLSVDVSLPVSFWSPSIQKGRQRSRGSKL